MAEHNIWINKTWKVKVKQMFVFLTLQFVTVKLNLKQSLSDHIIWRKPSHPNNLGTCNIHIKHKLNRSPPKKSHSCQAAVVFFPDTHLISHSFLLPMLFAYAAEAFLKKWSRSWGDYDETTCFYFPSMSHLCTSNVIMMLLYFTH